jgi:hypothetical protein
MHLFPSPSPTPIPPLPKLALISEFPPSYNGITANLTATSNNATCVEAPSARLNETNNVTLATPGPGFCNEDGSMPQGNYSFSETAPPGTVFDRWECYEIIGSNVIGPISSGKTPTIDLTGTKQITCKAIYTLATPLPRYGGNSYSEMDWHCGRPFVSPPHALCQNTAAVVQQVFPVIACVLLHVNTTSRLHWQQQDQRERTRHQLHNSRRSCLTAPTHITRCTY